MRPPQPHDGEGEAPGEGDDGEDVVVGGVGVGEEVVGGSEDEGGEGGDGAVEELAGAEPDGGDGEGEGDGCGDAPAEGVLTEPGHRERLDGGRTHRSLLVDAYLSEDILGESAGSHRLREVEEGVLIADGGVAPGVEVTDVDDEEEDEGGGDDGDLPGMDAEGHRERGAPATEEEGGADGDDGGVEDPDVVGLVVAVEEAEVEVEGEERADAEEGDRAPAEAAVDGFAAGCLAGEDGVLLRAAPGADGEQHRSQDEQYPRHRNRFGTRSVDSPHAIRGDGEPAKLVVVVPAGEGLSGDDDDDAEGSDGGAPVAARDVGRGCAWGRRGLGLRHRSFCHRGG